MDQEIAQVQTVYQFLIEFFVNYSFQLIGAVAVFIIGLIVANKLSSLLNRTLLRNKVDVTLSGFLAGIVRVIILGVVIIVVLNKVGISITPLIAAIGAVSIGAGLAVQGLLSNYASGVSIIIMRPFVVGDTIQVQGVKGVVKEISLAFTLLKDEDDVAITIPNKHIVGEIFHNSNQSAIVEGSIGVAYDSDPDQVIKIIKSVLMQNDVDRDKAIVVGIDEFADSSINFAYRYWIKTERYHETRLAINVALLKAFRSHNIAIPYPQREIKILNT